MINTAVKLQRSTGTMICGRNGGLQLAYVLARHLDMKSHLYLWSSTTNSLVSVVLDQRLTCICGPRPASHLYLWSSTINSLVSVVPDHQLTCICGPRRSSVARRRRVARASVACCRCRMARAGGCCRPPRPGTGSSAATHDSDPENSHVVRVWGKLKLANLYCSYAHNNINTWNRCRITHVLVLRQRSRTNPPMACQRQMGYLMYTQATCTG